MAFTSNSELWKNYNQFDIHVKQVKMTTTKTDLCSDRIGNNGDGLIGNEGSDCSTRTFDINTGVKEFRPKIILPIP